MVHLLLVIKFSIKKGQAQRSLKHFHPVGVLFTAQDLISEGIHLLQNKNPQEYFAVCMKAEILENLKKRKSVPVQPTGINLPKDSVYPLSSAIEHQKAQTFLETLVALAYAPPYIHRLLPMFHLNRLPRPLRRSILPAQLIRERLRRRCKPL